MATILAYTSPSLGNLYPLCALLTELRQRGHRIALRTLVRGVGTGRALGFDTAPIDESIESVEMTDWKAANGREALKVAFDVFGMRAPLEADDMAGAIASESPSAVIVDPNTWGAATVAEASGLPWATFYPYTPLVRSAGTPPFGPGLRPWPGLRGRLRDGLVRPAVMKAVDNALVVPVNKVRYAAGLPPVGSAEQFLLRAPLMLVASAEPFQYVGFGRDCAAMELIGPCDFDPPASDTDPLLDGVAGPVVLVTTSSDRQADTELGCIAMETLADEPVEVIATFPCGLPDRLFLPANARAVEFAPHGRVLDRAVCAITHGGMGVTQKALARGVPVCVVPYGRDQFEVARRVDVARCGTWLPSKNLSAQRLRIKVQQAMSMTEGARRVARGFAAAGGVAAGADLVEQRLLTT